MTDAELNAMQRHRKGRAAGYVQRELPEDVARREQHDKVIDALWAHLQRELDE